MKLKQKREGKKVFCLCCCLTTFIPLLVQKERRKIFVSEMTASLFRLCHILGLRKFHFAVMSCIICTVFFLKIMQIRLRSILNIKSDVFSAQKNYSNEKMFLLLAKEKKSFVETYLH